jgi:hypothetical protein
MHLLPATISIFIKKVINIYDVINLKQLHFQQVTDKNKTNISERGQMNKNTRYFSIFDKIITKMTCWIKKNRIFVQISYNIYT